MSQKASRPCLTPVDSGAPLSGRHARPARKVRIDQFLSSLKYGDGIGNDCLAIRATLQEAGYESTIYTDNLDPRLNEYGVTGIKKLRDYKDDADVILCHIAYRWDYMLKLDRLKAHKIFVWHNVTPPQFAEDYGDYDNAASCRTALEQVRKVRFTPSLCLTPSTYNKTNLEQMGYLCPIKVSSLLKFFDEEKDRDFDTGLLERCHCDGYVNILFVGRIAPHKRQQDIIAAFYYYHTFINPKSRLFIVGGGPADSSYYRAVSAYPSALGLDSVVFAGHCSDRQLASYYRAADVFLCMSGHEGFCVPLIEAMHYGVPIVAYDSSAVAETLGGAGIVLKDREPSLVAEAIDRIANDERLRETLIANGRERLADFAENRVKSLFLAEMERYLAYWRRKRTIYFDVTRQRQSDLGTGIQRLEKAELKLFYEADEDFKTVPFYFDKNGKGLFDCETGRRIAPRKGDIIYSPGVCDKETVENARYLDRYKTEGGYIYGSSSMTLFPSAFPRPARIRLFPHLGNGWGSCSAIRESWATQGPR